MEQIPLVDLKAQYFAHKGEFDEAIKNVIENTAFMGGAAHSAFEKEFAEFCGGGHIVLCGNGTDALELGITATLGTGDGKSEIITVSHTFVATTEAISNAGYRPVFVDIDPETHLMNTALIEKVITPKTKAIIPVHLYGQMVPMDQVMDIANRHNLKVIEDAAQAHGALWMNRGPGQWGDCACFSFYPGKNLGAWGDGGAVFTRNERIALHIRMLSNHGCRPGLKYVHDARGRNSRLDGIQAAVLKVKLKYLLEWNKKRREIAGWYDELLKTLNNDIIPVKVREKGVAVRHLYVVQVKNRDEVLKKLNSSGIGAGIHYPIPVHEQPGFQDLGTPPESLPVTHQVTQRIISLPIYPEMTRKHVEDIVNVLKNAVKA